MLFILFQNGGYAYVPSEKIVNPKTSLVFALKEEVGTLHEALKVFKVCNF
jgi:prephenate dehydratase